MNTGIATVRRVAALLAIMVGSLAGTAAPAPALESPADAWFGWEGQGGPLHPGRYVIGDSISIDVPYIETGSRSGAHVWVRWQAGWSTYPHRRNAWGVGNVDSFTDAERSPASIVGWGRSRTPFGEAVFATQYFFGYRRWGNYNYETQLFYPSTDWTPVAN